MQTFLHKFTINNNPHLSRLLIFRCLSQIEYSFRPKTNSDKNIKQNFTTQNFSYFLFLLCCFVYFGNNNKIVVLYIRVYSNALIVMRSQSFHNGLIGGGGGDKSSSSLQLSSSDSMDAIKHRWSFITNESSDEEFQ